MRTLLVCAFGFAVASSGCRVSAQTDSLPEISLFGLFGRAIILNKTWTGIQKSGTDQLTAALYSFGSSKSTPFSWSSSNPSVVTVSSSGFLTSVGNGSAIVSVSEPGGAVATCRVTVYSGFVYASLDGVQQVSRLTMNTGTGLLTFNSITGTIGSQPTGVATDPAGRFLYTGDFGGNTISQFTITAATGVLAANVPPSIATGGGSQPRNIRVTPDGRFLYLSAGGAQLIQAYSINQSTGTLTFINSYPAGAAQTDIDPTGRYLIAATTSGVALNTFSIDQSTGALTLIATSASLNLIGPATFHPSGQFFYTDSGSPDSVTALRLDMNTGRLTVVGTVATGVGPNGSAVHPSGNFLYTANLTGGTISVFTINQTDGSLTFASTAPAAVNIRFIIFDPTGNYAYVANNAGNLLEYSVDQNTGALTSIGSVNPSGNQWNLTLL